jgi:GNAT superfamily N-acetyltransferase
VGDELGVSRQREFDLIEVPSRITRCPSSHHRRGHDQTATPERRSMVVPVDRLCESDRGRWQELFVAYNSFYRRTLPVERYDTAWKAFMAETRLHALGARLGGSLVGIAHFLTHASTTTEDACYMQDLFTSPAARGHGAARSLIAAVTAWAREQDCSRVYWSTQENNTTARRLYDRVAVNHGFILYRIDL